jgi:hypothetical protein
MIKNNIPVQMAEKRMNIQKVSDLTGISRTTLSKIVNDKFTRIDLKTIDVLCKVLECNTQDLLEYIPD